MQSGSNFLDPRILLDPHNRSKEAQAQKDEINKILRVGTNQIPPQVFTMHSQSNDIQKRLESVIRQITEATEEFGHVMHAEKASIELRKQIILSLFKVALSTIAAGSLVEVIENVANVIAETAKEGSEAVVKVQKSLKGHIKKYEAHKTIGAKQNAELWEIVNDINRGYSNAITAIVEVASNPFSKKELADAFRNLPSHKHTARDIAEEIADRRYSSALEKLNKFQKSIPIILWDLYKPHMSKLEDKQERQIELSRVHRHFIRNYAQLFFSQDFHKKNLSHNNLLSPDHRNDQAGLISIWNTFTIQERYFSRDLFVPQVSDPKNAVMDTLLMRLLNPEFFQSSKSKESSGVVDLGEGNLRKYLWEQLEEELTPIFKHLGLLRLNDDGTTKKDADHWDFHFWESDRKDRMKDLWRAQTVMMHLLDRYSDSDNPLFNATLPNTKSPETIATFALDLMQAEVLFKKSGTYEGPYATPLYLVDNIPDYKEMFNSPNVMKILSEQINIEFMRKCLTIPIHNLVKDAHGKFPTGNRMFEALENLMNFISAHDLCDSERRKELRAECIEHINFQIAQAQNEWLDKPWSEKMRFRDAAFDAFDVGSSKMTPHNGVEIYAANEKIIIDYNKKLAAEKPSPQSKSRPDFSIPNLKKLFNTPEESNIEFLDLRHVKATSDEMIGPVKAKSKQKPDAFDQKYQDALPGSVPASDQKREKKTGVASVVISESSMSSYDENKNRPDENQLSEAARFSSTQVSDPTSDPHFFSNIGDEKENTNSSGKKHPKQKVYELDDSESLPGIQSPVDSPPNAQSQRPKRPAPLPMSSTATVFAAGVANSNPAEPSDIKDKPNDEKAKISATTTPANPVIQARREQPQSPKGNITVSVVTNKSLPESETHTKPKDTVKKTRMGNFGGSD